MRNTQKLFYLIILTLVFQACNNKTQITNNCFLVKTNNNQYNLITEWKFVHDTVYQVELIGKRNEWIYAYGKNKNKWGWMHIWDNNDVVKVFFVPGKKTDRSFHDREDARLYAPEMAIEILTK